VLFYGKGGDSAPNRCDEQELSVACLHTAAANPSTTSRAG
jgi:hypothetical protein